MRLIRMIGLAFLLCVVSTSRVQAEALPPVPAALLKPRDGLGHVLQKLEAGEPVKIAYLGGSITAAAGWRVKSMEQFRKLFPQARIEGIDAAIGGTGSDLGVFRYQHDALQYHPDLVFVEFAVNDGGAPPQRIWQAMEGIVRQTWAADPQADICFVYTFRTGYEQDLRKGVCPRAAAAMELLADHYGIPSINFALEIVQLEQEGRLTFQADQATSDKLLFSTDGVHPLDAGHEIYAERVAHSIREMRTPSSTVDHALKLQKVFVSDHWQAAKMVPLAPELLTGDWRKLPEQGGPMQSFTHRMGQLWEATEPGSKIAFRCRGSFAGLYDLLGPDGGQVWIEVDGQRRDQPVPRFDSYCTYHRIATLPLMTNGTAQETHTILVELDAQQPDRQPVAFRLKDPEVELKSSKYQGTRLRVAQLMLIGDLISP